MRKQTSASNLRAARSRSSSRDHPATFFSIFYRGVNKINKSHDHPDSAGDGSKGSKGQSSPGMERKRTTDYGDPPGKYSQKPPLPLKSKDNRSVFATQPAGAVKTRVSKSISDLNKYQQYPQSNLKQINGENGKSEPNQNGAPAEQNQNGTSNGGRGSFLTRKFPMLASAPSSPTPKPRRGIFGSFGGKSQSAIPDENHLNGNGHLNGGPINGIDDEEYGDYDAPAKLSFSQRIKLHKGVRTGKIPVDVLRYTHHKSQQVITNGELAEVEAKNKKAKKGKAGKKAVSVDTGINELDTDHLTAALFAIADEQPIVARSTPKHTILGPDHSRKTKERMRKNCIYEPDVYDKMLNDSIQICDLLQSHLNECIVGVRARSPTALSSPFTTPPGTPMLSRSASSQPIYGGRAFSPLLVHPPRVTIAISNGVSQRGSVSQGPGQFPVAGAFTPGSSLPPLPTAPPASSGNVSPAPNYVPIRRPAVMTGPMPKSGERRLHFAR